MSSSLLIGLEMALVLGLVVLFAVWELRSLNRAKREREAKQADERP